KFCRCRCLEKFINYDFSLFVYKQISCLTRPAFATPRSESRDPLWVATHRLKTTGLDQHVRCRNNYVYCDITHAPPLSSVLQVPVRVGVSNAGEIAVVR